MASLKDTMLKQLDLGNIISKTLDDTKSHIGGQQKSKYFFRSKLGTLETNRTAFFETDVKLAKYKLDRLKDHTYIRDDICSKVENDYVD